MKEKEVMSLIKSDYLNKELSDFKTGISIIDDFVDSTTFNGIIAVDDLEDNLFIGAKIAVDNINIGKKVLHILPSKLNYTKPHIVSKYYTSLLSGIPINELNDDEILLKGNLINNMNNINNCGGLLITNEISYCIDVFSDICKLYYRYKYEKNILFDLIIVSLNNYSDNIVYELSDLFTSLNTNDEIPDGSWSDDWVDNTSIILINDNKNELLKFNNENQPGSERRYSLDFLLNISKTENNKADFDLLFGGYDENDDIVTYSDYCEFNLNTLSIERLTSNE